MRKLITFFIFSFLIASTSFSQTNYCIEHRFSEGYYFDSSQIKVTTNVTYAVSERWPAHILDSLKFDLFEPEASADPLAVRPFILLIHGGAFLSGAKTDMHYQCMEYARRGFVAATIEYRLGWNCGAGDLVGVCLQCGSNNYDLQTATYRAVQDGRAAMRYFTANANTYGIDTAWMIIGGESAGSITALQTTFWDQQEGDAFASWAKGKVGLLDTAGNNLPNNFSIKAVIDNCGAVSRDSVVLNNGSIPVVSFHDENDCVVPAAYGQVISCVCTPFYWAAGSSAIHTKMNAAGICNELNIVPSSVNHCSYPAWNLVKHASCFIKRLMCNDCASGYTTNVSSTVACDTLQSITSSMPNIKIEPYYQLSYFPNPANTQVTFDLSGMLSQAPLKISITDAAGRVVEECDGLSQPAYLSRTIFNASGVYFIAVLSRTKVIATGKLMAQ